MYSFGKYIYWKGKKTLFITEALKEESIKLQKKIIIWFGKSFSKQDLYTRRNNLEIHGMPAVDVKEDDQLGQKVTDIFSDLYINISKPDIDEDCHQLGKSLGLSITMFAKMHWRKNMRSKDLLITQSLVLKGKKNPSSVWVLLPATSILHGCGGS